MAEPRNGRGGNGRDGNGGDDGANPSAPIHDDPAVQRPQVACQGNSFSANGPDDRFGRFADELRFWATSTQLTSALGKHRYVHDLSTGELTVFHVDCKKLADAPSPGERAMCVLCGDKMVKEPGLRSALRLNLKVWAAKVLFAQLFRGPEATEAVWQSLRATMMYRVNPKLVESVIVENPVKLKQWVRKSFAKRPGECSTPILIEFIELVVRPCMKVNVSDCSGEMQYLANSFASQLASSSFSFESMERLTLQIMTKAAGGKLANSPVVLGIVLQCLDMSDRRDRGILSMYHPRDMSDIERAVVEEAAYTLAVNGCSEGLMKTLGFNKKCTLRSHGALDTLRAQSLPCGALALLFADGMNENLAILDGIYPRDEGQKRRMCFCFDSTYLLPMHQSIRLNQTKALVGAPFCMDDLDSRFPNCFQEVVMGEKIRERTKANRMLPGFSPHGS